MPFVQRQSAKEISAMKILGKFALFGAVIACSVAAMAAQPGPGSALITVLPPAGTAPNPVTLEPGNLKLKVAGKSTPVLSVTRAHGEESPLELVILIDGSLRGGIGNQLDSIGSFVKEMPTGSKTAIAYMQNGRAVFGGPFSANPNEVAAELRLPSGAPGSSGSPYFCLTELAKHWPSNDTRARREVVMITDGIDNYAARYDPNDMYVQSSISDSIRAGLVVYSIYWSTQPPIGTQSPIALGGQSHLAQVSEATGGVSFGLGIGNPVSFDSFFQEIRERVRNQYIVTFEAPAAGKAEIVDLRVKLAAGGAKLTAPSRVLIGQAGK